jgi:hypothetical protein
MITGSGFCYNYKDKLATTITAATTRLTDANDSPNLPALHYVGRQR